MTVVRMIVGEDGSEEAGEEPGELCTEAGVEEATLASAEASTTAAGWREDTTAAGAREVLPEWNMLKMSVARNARNFIPIVYSFLGK
jgi:hypothetical protein